MSKLFSGASFYFIEDLTQMSFCFERALAMMNSNQFVFWLFYFIRAVFVLHPILAPMVSPSNRPSAGIDPDMED